MPPESLYDAVLFDNDGVIVERTTPATMTPAIRAAFRDVGVDDPDPEHVEYFLRGRMDEMAAICREYGVDHEAFWERRERRVLDAQRRVIESGEKALYDDVAVVDDIGADCAIVSNNQDETVEFVVDHHGLADRFDPAIGREMSVAGVRRKKPEPDLIEDALAALGAETALYVGDSATDVAAAHAAGIDSVYVDRPHHDPEALDREPTHTVADLTELRELV
ncbi:HAD family hydrolase [Halostella litorea]|uniref:HAD family hydrolase n=1 Tax=Halostella litorea TaxID=2528831 RepID=UPI0010920CC9|nr:HAD family hydrolase [Halostella litorea]